MHAFRLRATLALALSCCFAPAEAQVALGATETFDSLANTGSSATLPAGWLIFEGGGGSLANGQYTAGSGASTSGDTYSFGAAGSVDRALGSLASGSVQASLGARIVNDSGSTLTSLQVTFVTEQWRLGSTGSADRLAFAYNTSQSTTGIDGTVGWTPVAALDAVAPVTAGTASTALDGNDAANRVQVTHTITGLSLPAGQFLWVRWVDIDDGGSDDGLALDTVTFGQAIDNPPTLTAATPADGAIDVAPGATIQLTFSEAVSTGPEPWFALTCGGNGIAASASGSGNARVITPAALLPNATTCVLDLDENRVADLDGSAATLIAGALGYTDFDFTVAPDVAPTVSAIAPAHQAVNVPSAANVVITFSEPVTVATEAADWILLDCGGGPVAGTVSGGQLAYTFDPAATLPASATCQVTLTPTGVLDRDGPPTALTGQTVFSFTVADDLAPTVTSTYPVHQATNVPPGADLTVVFNEAVDAAAGAFVLECPVGTALAAAASSADGITWGLVPAAELPADTACRLTVVANLIADRDGNPNAMGANVVVAFTTGAGLSGYYERVDASSCRTLRGTLHGTIDDHAAVVYSDNDNTNTPGNPSSFDVWEVLNLADEDPNDSSRVIDIYKNESYTKIAGGQAVYNREHTWPNSHGFNDVTSLDGFPNAPYTDTHMLMVSNSAYNTDRNNRAFGVCNPASIAGCQRLETSANASNGTGGGPQPYATSGPQWHNWFTPSVNEGDGTFEIWHYRRGDVARAMLYMDVRFEGGDNARNGQREPDLILTDDRNAITATAKTFVPVGYSGLLTPLLAWAQQDAPTPLEGLRNDIVESVQGNRNPFVDHPEWIAIAFASNCAGPDVVAVDDDFRMTQGGVLSAPAPGVLRDDRTGFGNQGGPTLNGQGLTASIVSPPANGSATITNAATGAFTYTPNAAFCGTDSFTYAASNGAASDQGVAWIEVACSGGGVSPTAVNDDVNATEDGGQQVFTVLANDTDPDGGPKRVESVTQPNGGSVAIAPNGADVRFTPNANFCASTSFQYTLNGGSSATVSVSMTCFNDAPVVTPATFALAENSAGGTTVGTVAANDPDAASVLSFAITAGDAANRFAISAGGTITVNAGAALDFESTPTITLTVQASDNAVPAATGSANVTINLSNVEEGAAQAAADAFTVGEDSGSNAFTVLANDTADPDGGALVVTGVGTPQHGTAGFTAGGIAYTPAANYCGADAVTYTIGGGSTAQVSITVSCVNDAPVAQSATFALAENSAPGTAVGTVTATDPDVAQPRSWSLVGGNGAGAFAIDPVTGAITVAASAPLDFEATPQFVLTVRVTDGGVPALASEAAVTINLSNVDEGSGLANDDALAVNEDAPATEVDVLANDGADPDGDALQVIAVSAAQHGTASFTAANVAYTPAADFCGADSFTYTLAGGDTATVAVTVACVTDAPTAAGTLPDRIAKLGQAVDAFPVATAFTAADAFALRAEGLPPGLALSAGGVVSGTPTLAGEFVVTVFAENAGGSASAQFTLTVLGPSVFASGFED